MWIESITALEALYGTPGEASKIKVTPRLSEGYRAHIERARFCVLSTVGPEGTDGSPRGDEGPVVQVLDEKTLLLPDWRGNERIDSLRNIIRDPRVSLMFLITGSNTAIRVNGRAGISTDPVLIEHFAKDDKAPRSVLVIHIDEVYAQCARALIRSDLWGEDQSIGLPSMGDILAEIDPQFDGAAYDAQWPSRAVKTMW